MKGTVLLLFRDSQITVIAQEGNKALHITLHGTHAITFTEER